jgi:hypothetical protein
MKNLIELDVVIKEYDNIDIAVKNENIEKFEKFGFSNNTAELKK